VVFRILCTVIEAPGFGKRSTHPRFIVFGGNHYLGDLVELVLRLSGQILGASTENSGHWLGCAAYAPNSQSVFWNPAELRNQWTQLDNGWLSKSRGDSG